MVFCAADMIKIAQSYCVVLFTLMQMICRLISAVMPLKT